MGLLTDDPPVQETLAVVIPRISPARTAPPMTKPSSSRTNSLHAARASAPAEEVHCPLNALPQWPTPCADVQRLDGDPLTKIWLTLRLPLPHCPAHDHRPPAGRLPFWPLIVRSAIAAARCRSSRRRPYLLALGPWPFSCGATPFLGASLHFGSLLSSLLLRCFFI